MATDDILHVPSVASTITKPSDRLDESVPESKQGDAEDVTTGDSIVPVGPHDIEGPTMTEAEMRQWLSNLAQLEKKRELNHESALSFRDQVYSSTSTESEDYTLFHERQLKDTIEIGNRLREMAKTNDIDLPRTAQLFTALNRACEGWDAEHFLVCSNEYEAGNEVHAALISAILDKHIDAPATQSPEVPRPNAGLVSFIVATEFALGDNSTAQVPIDHRQG